MRSLLLLGGGGHCLTVLDALHNGSFTNIAIIDAPEMVGFTLGEIPFIGTDAELSALRDTFSDAFISIGGIGAWQKRAHLLTLLSRYEYHIPTIIHPHSIVSYTSTIGKGTLVAAGAIVNGLSEIGDSCILNTSCIVEHECQIHRLVHIAPGAVLCANVTVGEGSHIGAGSVVRQGINIGKNVLLGIGSVVTTDIPDHTVAFGNPCRVVRKRDIK